MWGAGTTLFFFLVYFISDMERLNTSTVSLGGGCSLAFPRIPMATNPMFVGAGVPEQQRAAGGYTHHLRQTRIETCRLKLPSEMSPLFSTRGLVHRFLRRRLHGRPPCHDGPPR